MAQLFADADLDRLIEDIYHLLSEVGLRVDHSKVAEEMRSAGCQPRADGRLRIPKGLLDELIERQRVRQRQQKCLVRPVDSDMAQLMDRAFSPGPTKYYDYEQRKTMRVDTPTFTRMIQFAEATPEIAMVSPWVRQDTAPAIEPIESVVLGLKLSRKMLGIDALVPAQVKYLVEISEIVTGRSGDTTYLRGSQCMTSPLILGHRSAEEIAERARCGVEHYFIASMAMVGVNTPITLAGAVVVAAAEILGGIVAAYLMNPAAALTGGVVTTVMDMHSGGATLAAPENCLLQAGVCELFERRLGGHIIEDMQYAPCSPVPGLQVVYENFLTAMAETHLMGQRRRYVGRGLLANGGVGSPVQAMLDIEVMKSLAHVDLGIPVADATLQSSEIIERIRDGKDFLTSEYTLSHFRDLWIPRFFVRQTTDLRASSEAAILERCNSAWRENVKQYHAPNWPEDTLCALDDVVRRARAELCV